MIRLEAVWCFRHFLTKAKCLLGNIRQVEDEGDNWFPEAANMKYRFGKFMVDPLAFEGAQLF